MAAAPLTATLYIVNQCSSNPECYQISRRLLLEQVFFEPSDPRVTGLSELITLESVYSTRYDKQVAGDANLLELSQNPLAVVRRDQGVVIAVDQ